MGYSAGPNKMPELDLGGTGGQSLPWILLWPREATSRLQGDLGKNILWHITQHRLLSSKADALQIEWTLPAALPLVMLRGGVGGHLTALDLFGRPRVVEQLQRSKMTCAVLSCTALQFRKTYWK